MKFNKWTLGLAALGVVSIGSVARAEEAHMNAVQTALASTVISGYVDTSFEWNDNDYVAGLIPFRGPSKQDGFNLNVVKLSLEKALDESEWASGYKVDLLFGPDAVGYNSSANVSSASDFGIKQAYVALRTPIGNGIDWKMGVFDTIIGYESFDSCNNPNFTRSWGYNMEPTQHTGLLGTYRVNDMLSVSAGVANTLSAGINNRNDELGEDSYWRKTWMASIAITAPDSAGALSGSTLYAGAVGGWSGGANAVIPGASTEDQVNYYVGATLSTPVSGLKCGVAFDYADSLHGVSGYNAWTLAGYLSYQATEKLSLHGRFEYGQGDAAGFLTPGFIKQQFTDADIDPEDYAFELDSLAKTDTRVVSATGTIQYNLWSSVVSRLEVRWDSFKDRDTDTEEDSIGLYANLTYKF